MWSEVGYEQANTGSPNVVSVVQAKNLSARTGHNDLSSCILQFTNAVKDFTEMLAIAR
jgi:hypothetical protein